MNEDLPQKLVRLQNQKAELAARLIRLEETRKIELVNGCVALQKLLDVCEGDNRWISKVSQARGIRGQMLMKKSAPELVWQAN